MTYIPIFNHTWPRKFRHRFFFRPMFFPHCFRASKWSNHVLWSTYCHIKDEGIGDLSIHKPFLVPKGLDGWMVSILRCHLGRKKHVHWSIIDVNVYHHFCISVGIFLFSIGCWVQYHILPSTEWLHHHSRRPRAAKESLNLSRETWVKDLAKTVVENHGCHWWHLVFHCRTRFSQRGTINTFGIHDTYSLLVCLDSFKGNVELSGTSDDNGKGMDIKIIGADRVPAWRFTGRHLDAEKDTFPRPAVPSVQISLQFDKLPTSTSCHAYIRCGTVIYDMYL